MYTAFLSALVFTGDPDAPRAEAVLVKGNTIVALGSDEEIERQSPPDTQKIHLPGSFITPGLVDAHTHLWGMGYTLNMVDLRGMTSLETCLSAIAEAAQKAAPGEWVLGRNWNQNIWRKKRTPPVTIWIQSARTIRP